MRNFTLPKGPYNFLNLRISPWEVLFLLLLCFSSLWRFPFLHRRRLFLGFPLCLLRSLPQRGSRRLRLVRRWSGRPRASGGAQARWSGWPRASGGGVCGRAGGAGAGAAQALEWPRRWSAGAGAAWRRARGRGRLRHTHGSGVRGWS
jgi:hypothetical protein